MSNSEEVAALENDAIDAMQELAEEHGYTVADFLRMVASVTG